MISTTVLPFGDQLGRLLEGRSPGIGEFRLNFAIVLKVPQSRRRTNGRSDEGTALRGLSQFLDANLVAGFAENLEVGNHFVPIEQLAVDAHAMSEVAFWRGRLRRETQRPEKRDGDQRFHAGRGQPTFANEIETECGRIHGIRMMLSP